MNMEDWAKNEIEIACKHERGDKNPEEFDYYRCACYESAYKAFQSLMEDGHSGTSIGFTKAILNRLIDGKPLTPIEDTSDIWLDRSSTKKNYASYQCKRMSSLFKDVYNDGFVQYRDINRFYCLNKDDPDGVGWHNGFINQFLDAQFPITMPYSPASKPWYVYCTEGLSDPKNGDFDSIGIHYVLKPDGEHVEIQRFFKEGENSWIEIDQQEYDNRVNCMKTLKEKK